MSRLQHLRSVRAWPLRQLRRTDDTIAELERQEVAATRAARTPPPQPRGWKLAMRRAGGRRVTIRGRSAGIAHGDADVVEFLRRAGLPDAWEYLDDPHRVERQDGRSRTYDTTPPGHGDHGEVIG